MNRESTSLEAISHRNKERQTPIGRRVSIHIRRRRKLREQEPAVIALCVLTAISTNSGIRGLHSEQKTKYEIKYNPTSSALTTPYRSISYSIRNQHISVFPGSTFRTLSPSTHHLLSPLPIPQDVTSTPSPLPMVTVTASSVISAPFTSFSDTISTSQTWHYAPGSRHTDRRCIDR